MIGAHPTNSTRALLPERTRARCAHEVPAKPSLADVRSAADRALVTQPHHPCWAMRRTRCCSISPRGRASARGRSRAGAGADVASGRHPGGVRRLRGRTRTADHARPNDRPRMGRLLAPALEHAGAAQPGAGHAEPGRLRRNRLAVRVRPPVARRLSVHRQNWRIDESHQLPRRRGRRRSRRCGSRFTLAAGPARR